MKKELSTNLVKSFDALKEFITANPKEGAGVIKEVRGLLKDLNEHQAATYTARVTAAKAEREEKRAVRAKAISEAKALKEEAKAKFTAAMAIKVNNKIASKRKAKATIDHPAVNETEEALPDIF